MSSEDKAEEPGIFDHLDDYTRVFAYVGRFFGQWATMEAEINRAIGKALKLDLLQQTILTAEVDLSRRIQILRTAIKLSPMTDEDRKNIGERLTDLLNNKVRIRNIIAHNLFHITEDRKGIRFFYTKVKGTLTLDPVVYSFEFLETLADYLHDTTSLLESVDEKIIPPISAEFIRALSQIGTPPTGGLLGTYLPSPSLSLQEADKEKEN